MYLLELYIIIYVFLYIYYKIPLETFSSNPKWLPLQTILEVVNVNDVVWKCKRCILDTLDSALNAWGGV